MDENGTRYIVGVDPVLCGNGSVRRLEAGTVTVLHAFPLQGRQSKAALACDGDHIWLSCCAYHILADATEMPDFATFFQDRYALQVLMFLPRDRWEIRWCDVMSWIMEHVCTVDRLEKQLWNIPY